ncbi:IclR family transcriptional regulator [Burkholderia sp. SCN-KJ]|uniref:IclR family transcriptional regulator n=1 Tax=Burkholderia sp. SCN-KJ TaxID=2969248 RepID=UPI00214F6297|nr:IclR family transcriptional regulator [Burkholderia sp. SCN-KJ]MCR4470440.1 IclR family transcriptional regulator [Burkholderia sp. SCN-KJ]
MAAKKPETEQSSGRPDSSTERVLGLLDLFTPEHAIWTADMLIEHQGLGRATVYRYLRALTDSGFLTPVGGGGYALGPRFIEMDRQIRLADPLLQIAPPLMEAMRDQVAGSQLLCRYYGLRVLCIHQEQTDARIHSAFQRGKPFPLFKGSPSRIILANLPQPRLQKLFLYHSDEIKAANLGDSWIEFRDQMRAIRKTGYSVASDLDKTLVGVSAPIFVGPDEVTGSLCLVRLRAECDDKDIERLGEFAMEGANEITSRLKTGRVPPAETAAVTEPKERSKRPRKQAQAHSERQRERA